MRKVKVWQYSVHGPTFDSWRKERSNSYLTSCRQKIDIVFPARGKRVVFHTCTIAPFLLENRRMQGGGCDWNQQRRKYRFSSSRRAATILADRGNVHCESLRDGSNDFSGGARPQLSHHHRQWPGVVFTQPRRKHIAERENPQAELRSSIRAADRQRGYPGQAFEFDEKFWTIWQVGHSKECRNQSATSS